MNRLFFIFCLSLLIFTPLLKAKESSERLNKLESYVQKHPDNMKRRIQLAKLYFNNKNFKKVSETLDPFSTELSTNNLLLLAEAFKNQKRYSDEVRILKIIRSKNDKDHLAHFNLAFAFLRNNQTEEAIKSLRKSIDLKPTHRPSYQTLLDIFENSKNTYESRAIVNDMIERFGPQKEFLNHLCRLYSVDGYLEETIKYCRKAILKDPAHPENHTHLAAAYKDKGKIKMATKIFAQAAKQFPNSEPVQYQAGQFFLSENNNSVANRYFKKAVNADKNSVRSLVALADSEFEQKDFDSALVLYSRACRLDPTVSRQLQTAAGKLRSLNKSKLAKDFETKSYSCR